jgi:hypothetical protein
VKWRLILTLKGFTYKKQERCFYVPFHAAEQRRNEQKKREDCLNHAWRGEFRSARSF